MNLHDNSFDDLAPAQSRLDEASALTDEMLTRVRAMTVELRPTLLDDMGIVPTLRWYLGRFAARTGVQAQLEAPQWPTRLQAEIETTIYRVVQEALTNVARHAGVDKVAVRLWTEQGTLNVQIEDQGAGFDPEHALVAEESSGLVGMRERAVLLSGELTIESTLGAGTRLVATLPLDSPTG